MKKMILVIFCMFLAFSYAYAEENPQDNGLLEEYIEIYSDEMNEGIEEINQELPEGFDAEDAMRKASKGEVIFSPKEVILGLLEMFLEEIQKTFKMLILIPIIALLNTYLMGIQSNFSTKGAANAAFFVCYMIMAGIAATAFLEAVQCGKGVVENISIFMRTLIPVSLASLATSGAVVSATTFEIVIVSVIEVSEFLLEKVFIPLVLISAALNIVNNLSSSINMEKLVQLICRFVKWGTGIVLTLFVGITGLQGIVTGSADGLAVKVTKFATSNAIPMVGGILAETVETVMNCSVVIKNAVGVVGIIAVVIIAIVPLLKMTACLVLFRLCGAVIQPISDERFVKCVSQLGDSVSTVLAIGVAVVVMFVIILTIVINIGNMAIMFGR